MGEVTRRIKTKKRKLKYLKKETGDLRETYFKREWSDGFNQFMIDNKKAFWKYHKMMANW